MNIQKSLKYLLGTGLTQREIAKELCSSQAHVSDMANGKAAVKRPTLRMVAGIQRLLHARKKIQTDNLPPPEIPAHLQSASVMLKGLSGKFADEDAIAWFLQLKPKTRAEMFELHDCITSAMCIDEINRNQQSNGGQR